MSKVCSRCQTDKPSTPEFFHRNRRTKDGLSCWCIACIRSDYAANHGKRCAEKRAAYARNFAADPEPFREAGRKWRANNTAKANQFVRDFYKRNPDAHRAHQAARRARQRNAPGRFNAADISALHASQCGRCAYCFVPIPEYHIDHRQALAAGGTNWPDNLALACSTCNLSKGTMSASDFSLKTWRNLFV